MTREITNSEDVIDSRDVIKRIEELEEERQDLVDALQEAQEEYDASKEDGEYGEAEEEALEDAKDALKDWDEGYDAEELKTLKALAEEGEASPDWTYGETLIRDSYFETYAQELAEDIGAVPKDLSWPCCHIDWDAACDALQQDYLEVDFDGVTYWIRA